MSAPAVRHPLECVGIGRVLIHGSFRPNGSTGIVSGSEKGKGWSAVRTNTGLYTITFDDNFEALVSHWSSVREAAGNPTYCQFGDYVTTGATPTLQLRVMEQTTATHAVGDLAADADNEVAFGCIFRYLDIDY